jgi:hypothetical protein
MSRIMRLSNLNYLSDTMGDQTGGSRLHIGYSKPYEGNREADMG